jgi:hypothetical protein
MAAVVTEKKIITVAKDELFTALKTSFPSLFGTKVFADVESFMTDDPLDATNIESIFKKEPSD